MPSVLVHWLTGHNIIFIYSKPVICCTTFGRTKPQLNIKTVRSIFMTKSDDKVVVSQQKVEFCFKKIELQVYVPPPGLVESGGNIYLKIIDDTEIALY